MTARLRFAAVGTAALLAVAALAAPAGAGGGENGTGDDVGTATFRGAVSGTAKGGSTDCFTVPRADGRARFVARNAFRIGKVQYSMQAGFFGAANVAGRQDLVEDAPPGVTFLLVRSRDGRQWASAKGHVTLSEDGLTTRVRATLAPVVPARGRPITVKAVLTCATVADLPDTGG